MWLSLDHKMVSAQDGISYVKKNMFGSFFWECFPPYLLKIIIVGVLGGRLCGLFSFGVSPVPRVPQMSLSIPGKPIFPALRRVSSRGSTHTTVARGKALWESLVGKPRGKATDPLIHTKGSTTLLLQFGRKAHVHAPTRDED